MKLEDEFTAAMLAAGNKRSSIKSYWPHVVGFIQFTRERYGNWVHPSETKVEDVYAWRRYLATKLQLSPKSQNQAVSAIKFLFARVLGKPIHELPAAPTWQELCMTLGLGSKGKCEQCGEELVVHGHFKRGRAPPDWLLQGSVGL